MSILKSKHNGWLADGTRTPFTGGGGSSGPSQSTTQTSNIPDYARPYVENMLGSTQAQLFNTTKTGGTPDTTTQVGTDDSGNPIFQTTPGTEGRTEITGFKPYQAYSSNVNDYFAGPSDMQRQSYQGMSNMQVAPQIGEGSQMTGIGGMGSMGLGTQAAMSGANYANMATNPNSVSAYMSPYMQNVVDYQKSSALRDYAMAMPKLQAQAVGQGAFGGNRMALQQAEAGRGLMSQLQGIEAQGAQQAFDKATQAQQYGANLGLQGLQTGLQGYNQAINAGSQLGQLGQAQYGQQMGILQGQNQFGQQQQQMEQQKINQGISDYATQQQYPMLQLGMMSNMLRGLPMQSQTTQMYQAQPSALQQGIGLLGAGASLYGAQGRKEGGVIGYKYGGSISGPKLESMADKLTPEQLQAKLKDSQLDAGERQIFADALQDKARDKARYAGIAAAGGGLFDSMGYAGGGILAFEDGGEVEHFQAGGGAKDRSAFMQDLIDTFGYSDAKDAPPEVPDYLKRAGDYFTKPRKNTTMTPAQLDNLAASKGVFPEGSPALSEGTNIAAGPTQAERNAFYEKSAPGSQGSTGAKADSGIGGILAGLRKEGPKGELGTDYLERLKELEAGADQRMSKADKLAMAKGFLRFGATPAPGGIGQAAVAGLSEYTDQYGKAVESDEKFRMENAKLQSDIKNLQRAEERGDVKLAAELKDKIEDRANRLQTANISASAAGRSGAREDAYVKQLMAQGMSLEQALQAVKGAGKAESNDIVRAKAALAQINEQLMVMKKDDPSRAALITQRDQLTQALAGGGGTQVGGIPKDIQGIMSRYQ